MITLSTIANATETGSFAEVVQFCAIDLLLTLISLIAVHGALGEWLELPMVE